MVLTNFNANLINSISFSLVFSIDFSNYIFIVKVNGIANVTATTIISKYCDFDNFVELHKP